MNDEDWYRLERSLGKFITEEERIQILNRIKPDEINSNVPVYRPNGLDKQLPTSQTASCPQISE